MNEANYETINLNPPEDHTAVQIADLFRELDAMKRRTLSIRAKAIVDAELPSLEDTVKDVTSEQKTPPQSYHS